ncbi:MAG: 1-(5-phosphoribosyl)-5-[(5-phosphoribosylamino)methylideneamino]imidazole-4-carboxamide isomerase [Candidatus Omnitrophota bacterium]
MIIIAAVDIKDGKAVRLTGGDFKKDKIYFDNPVDAAMLWKSQGIQYLHVVDLEGAALGRLKNFKSIETICKAMNMPVEVGGGVRTEDDIRKVLSAGAKRAVLGTTAATDKDYLKKLIKKFKAKIIVSIDAVDGKVAVKGWKDKLKIEALDFIKELKSFGMENIIYTDIKRDGTLKGVRTEIAEKILKKTKVNLIFGGGISSIDDIISLKKLEKYGLSGVIIGKALYEGKIDLRKAIKIALE